MNIKIFHTADIHIGLKFSGRDYSPELKSKLQSEPLNCLKRMVDRANEFNCDLFVVAGDMFDRISIPKAEIKKAAEILNTFNGTHVIVLPGNHDFYEDQSESIWTSFSDKINEHLVIVLNKTEPYEILLGEKRVVLYPGPCKTKHSSHNEISWVRSISKDENSIHIGIAHGSVTGLSPDTEQNYYPMKPDELKNSGVDFWLLGHTHVRYPEYNGKGNPVYFMPSTPVPDGFDCMHEGYAWFIEVSEEKTLSYNSVRTGLFSFKTISKEINSYDDMEKLKNDVLKFDTSATLMKLKLYGRLNQDEISLLPRLFTELFETFAYVEIDYGEVVLKINSDYINKIYSENSLPHRLLSNLAASPENNLALQLAHKLIEEARA